MGEGNEICLRVECGDCLRRKISKSHIFNASATADTKPTTVFLRPTLRPSTSPLQILSSPSLSLSIHLFLSFFLFIGILSEILSTISFFLLLLLLLFFFLWWKYLISQPIFVGEGRERRGRGLWPNEHSLHLNRNDLKQCSFFFMSGERGGGGGGGGGGGFFTRFFRGCIRSETSRFLHDWVRAARPPKYRDSLPRSSRKYYFRILRVFFRMFYGAFDIPSTFHFKPLSAAIMNVSRDVSKNLGRFFARFFHILPDFLFHWRQGLTD